MILILSTIQVMSLNEDSEEPDSHEAEPTRVILIGWDGVQRNHLYEMLENPERMPNLRKLCDPGNFVEVTVTSGCTDTKAGWAQILTGYDPEITGVYSNNYYQTIPEGYTIFERLENSFGNENITTIMVTGKAENIGAKAGFPFNNSIKNIDKYELDTERTADKVWELAEGHLEEYVINHTNEHLFAFIHFREPDYIGHLDGEDHFNYTRDVRIDDKYLGEIVNFLKENDIYNNTKIYVTSDHGYDEESADYPVNPINPGHQHRMAPYVFLATNDEEVIRDGDRKDITPTILTQFGINISQIDPPLSGASLTNERKPVITNGEVKNMDNIKNILLISWSGVQRAHLEEMLLKNDSLKNLKELRDQGRYIEIESAHLQASNVSGIWKFYGTDTTCGLATLSTGYDPDFTSVYNDYRFGTIPKGYTIFERLKSELGKNNITNCIITGKDNGTVGGVVPFNNASDSIDISHFNIAPDDVGPSFIKYLENKNTEYFFSLVHFSYPDIAGFEFGENSLEYEQAIQKCDDWLGKVKEKLINLGIYYNTLLYVTSTHGFDEQSAQDPKLPGKPGYNHSIAQHHFLATNDKGVIRHGYQKDIAPTILHRFGIDCNKMKPILPGKLLIRKKTNQLPIVIIKTNRTIGNFPLAVSFNGRCNDYDGIVVSFHWDFGDGNTSSKPNVKHKYDRPGNYSVTFSAIDDDNVGNMINVMIIVNEPPIAIINADKLSGKVPLSVSFTGGGIDNDGTIKSYSWDIGDDVKSNEQNVSHEYLKSGVKRITLTVTDNYDAIGVVKININVYGPDLDSDFDGMPDWYENEYGFDRYNYSDRKEDYDGDGHSNYKEFVAGVDPTDPMQFPKKQKPDTASVQYILISSGIIFLIIIILRVKPKKSRIK
jgi:PKD repeat protein/predicted AlkP superfamily pyrophosphatase or phosphodiesterase